MRGRRPRGKLVTPAGLFRVPELVAVEMGLASVREKVIAYMAEHGYVRIEQYAEHDFANWYYTPR